MIAYLLLVVALAFVYVVTVMLVAGVKLNRMSNALAPVKRLLVTDLDACERQLKVVGSMDREYDAFCRRWAPWLL